MKTSITVLILALMFTGAILGVAPAPTVSMADTTVTSTSTDLMADGGAPMPLCDPGDPKCDPGPAFPKK